MARELILNLNKNKSTFGISKIDRKKLYGFKKRLFFFNICFASKKKSITFASPF